MLVHDALSVMLVPTTGTGLGVVTAHERPLGGVEPVCHVTFTAAGVLVLVPLLAVTEYVRRPAPTEVARHVLVALGQFDQM